MDGGKCVLQLRGVRPFLSDKYDITRHHNYRYLADYSDKNIFNVKNHLSTRLKLKPDDEVEVHEIEITEDNKAIDTSSNWPPADL